MKQYLAYDSINGDYNDFDTKEQAERWLTDIFLERDEGYHPDTTDCCIYKLFETVKLTTTDKRLNYKYESEDAAIDADDQEAIDNEDFWPYDIDFEIVCKHEFVTVD